MECIECQVKSNTALQAIYLLFSCSMCTVYSVYSYHTHITGMDERVIKGTTKTVNLQLIICVTQFKLNANRGNEINIFCLHSFQ